MENEDDKFIGVILFLFVRMNSLVLILSGIPIVFVLMYRPIVIDVFKIVLIFISVLVYSITTLFYIIRKLDFTFLIWLISVPLVVYCAASSVEGIEWSNCNKNMNLVFYLCSYFFGIALVYRLAHFSRFFKANL